MGARIEEKYKDQVRSLKKEGQANIYIIEYMKAHYSLELNNKDIWYICNHKNKAIKKKDKEREAVEAPVKRPYKKKDKNTPPEKAPDSAGDVLYDEISALIIQLKEAYIEKLKSIRIELIQACGEIQQLKK